MVIFGMVYKDVIYVENEYLLRGTFSQISTNKCYILH